MASNPSTSEESITPDKAACYLERNHQRNRPISRTRVEALKAALAEKRFFRSHQGIAFHRSGNLIDGQHRLTAIVETGVGAFLLVTRGLDDDIFDAINTGGVRRDYERLYMGGLEVGKQEAALVKCVLGSISSPARAPLHLIREQFLKLKDALQFLREHAPPNKVATPIRAVIARAFYTAPRERLIEFCSVLVSSEVSCSGDGAAVALIKMLAKYDWATTSQRRTLYCLAQRSLSAFLRYETPAVLKPVVHELFQLPWEANHESNGNAAKE